MEQKKIRRNDWILIGVLLLAALAAGILFFRSQTAGQRVVVSVHTEQAASFPLNQDTEYLIQDGNDGYNILVIQDGEAWIQEANCTGQDCVSMGRISRTGEFIVCLPHEVIVQIEE